MENEKKRQNNEKNGDMSMADRFITAMFLPGDYPLLLKLTLGKIISFIGMLILLVSLIQYGIPVLAAIAGYGGVGNYIINELPDFSLSNGVFKVSERIENKNDDVGIYILVDTDVDRFTEDDISKDMTQVMLVGSTNIIMYNNITGVSGLVQEQRFSDLGNISVNNESVARMAPMIYFSMVVVFIMLYVFTLVRYLFSALFYALIMFVISRMMTGTVKFDSIYKIALFAQTVGAIVSAVANFIGTPVFVMAGSTFAMIVTVLIMNRAFFKIMPPPRAL